MKTIYKSRLVYVCSLALLLQLSGCSGGSAGGGGTLTSESVSIKGVAQAGPIDGTVKIYELDSNGERGKLLGTQDNVVNGIFEIAVPKSDNPVIVAATGTYKDEATGAIVDMKGLELTQILPHAKENAEAPVTPATTFVADMVQEKIRKSELLRMDAKTAIDESHQKVAQLFGVDPATIKAVPKPPTQMDSQSDEGRAALLLTAISQAMKDGELSPDKGVNPVEAIKSFSSNLAKKREEDKKISGDDFQDSKLRNFGNNWATKLKEARDKVIQSEKLEPPADWKPPKADVGNGRGNLPPAAMADTIKIVDQTPEKGLTASDPNGDVLTFSIVTPPSKGKIRWVNINTGSFEFIPNQPINSEFFTDVFTFIVTDGSLPSEVVTVNLTRIPTDGSPMYDDLIVVSPASSDRLPFQTGNDPRPSFRFNFWGGAKIALLYSGWNCEEGRLVGTSDLSKLAQPGTAQIQVDTAHSLSGQGTSAGPMGTKDPYFDFSLKVINENGISFCRGNEGYIFDTTPPTIEISSPNMNMSFVFSVSGDSNEALLYREDKCQGNPIAFTQLYNRWPRWYQFSNENFVVTLTVGDNGPRKIVSLDSRPFSAGTYSFSIKVIDVAGNSTCSPQIPITLAPYPRILSINPDRGKIGDSFTVSGIDFNPTTELYVTAPDFWGYTPGGTQVSKPAYSGLAPKGTCHFVSSSRLDCKFPSLEAFSSLPSYTGTPPSPGIPINLTLGPVQAGNFSQTPNFRLLPNPIPSFSFLSPTRGTTETTVTINGTGFGREMVLRGQPEGGRQSQVICKLGDSQCDFTNEKIIFKTSLLDPQGTKLPTNFKFSLTYFEDRVEKTIHLGNFALSVTMSSPPKVAYFKTSFIYTVGDTITDIIPTVSSTETLSYTVIPPLPDGLLLNPQSGIISGIPAQPYPQKSYKITASNTKESGSCDLTIEVLPTLYLDAQTKNREVTLTWNSVTEASSYNLYWSNTYPLDVTKSEKLSDVRSPYIFNGPAATDLFYFVVTAVSRTSGFESDLGTATGFNSAGIDNSKDSIISTELPSKSVTSIIGDVRNLYVGTRNGLFIKKKGASSFVAIKFPVEVLGAGRTRDHNNISSVALTGENVYVSSFDAGLFISKDQGTSFQYQSALSFPLFNSISSIAVESKNLYVATTMGLAVSTDSGTTFKMVKLYPGSNYEPLNSVAVSNGTVYVGSGFGLFISTNRGTSFWKAYLSDHLSSNNVQAIAIEGKNVYVGTAYGLFVSNNGGSSFGRLNLTQDWSSNDVKSLNIKGNHLYVGTRAGLFISGDGGNNFTKITTAHGLVSNEVKSIGALGESIYVGTEENGMCISDDNGATFSTIPFIDTPRNF